MESDSDEDHTCDVCRCVLLNRNIYAGPDSIYYKLTAENTYIYVCSRCLLQMNSGPA